MTVANRSIALATEPGITTGPVSSDLALELIAVLIRPGRPAQNGVSPSSFRGWLESSPSEGERWLRTAAQHGDAYAMEKLGLRLLTGDGLAKSIDDGLKWLRRSAELGNPFAMEKLAAFELDEQQEGPSTEGERWLRTAAECGYRLAMVNLGSRLIAGEGVAPNPKEGERLLRNAAGRGSRIAMIKLGIYLLSGLGVSRNREEGLRWLRRAAAGSSDRLSELGLYLYQKSLDASIGVRAKRLAAREAGVIFLEARRQGSSLASLNLAYLVRRREIEEDACLSLDELLSAHLKQNNPFALVNQALRLAQGIQCKVDWKVADAQFKYLQDSSDVLEWWLARSREGDPEGHLVTGWLSRHQLATDPDGFQIVQRMDLARTRGWQVPEWLNCPATA
jgi:TPR repeat protein